jgi:class 3 adenylate cyclase/tetratricopeptide (TPR) repeat protein
MTFEEILDQAIAMLQRRGRLTYSTLKRQFQLDDAALEDLKNELIEGQRLAVDEHGNVLVWTGAEVSASHPTAPHTSSHDRLPLAYTPAYLAEKILTSRSALEGERKLVTVLFADLKGSMELLADRDPEEARQLLDPVLERMMAAVHRYEGTVNQVLGDGIMALFGAPLAHEDHAARACYAALAMQAAIRRYSEEVRRSHGIAVQIRIGLNSGEVVVRAIGNDLHMDYSAIGQTTHLAARMEQLASPGSTLLTVETLRLVEGLVQVTPLGPVPVKGLDTPVEVFELMGASALRARFQARVAGGLTRFVGRDPELDVLRQRLDQAGAGHGQVVALIGEAGVGKSRLVYEFVHSHQTQGWRVLESVSVSYGKATPYFPVIDLLRRYCHVADGDEARTVRAKVTGQVLTLDETLQEAIPALLSLLDALPEDSSFLTLDPPQRRQRTLEALKRLLLRESQVQPLLLVCEDLHWIDTETQALLDRLVDGLPTARLLLLVNYRPEYQHGWSSKTSYTQLRLDPLSPVSADELLQALLGDDPSLVPLKRLLIARTEGNPFFLEESVRTLVETGVLVGERGAYHLAQALPTIQVPATVQAVLAARIDRLPPEDKRLLQTAAVIGTEVPFSLLQAIAEVPEEVLHRSLTQLQTAEFLYEARLFPELVYTFKHALTHEVAYGSLLHERRRALHAQIMAVLERLAADRLTEEVGRLAYHARRGEVWDKALHYGRQAGAKAMTRSAHQEAVTCFEQALDALPHLPEGPDTVGQGIDVRLDLRNALLPLGDYARIFAHLRDAEKLAEALDDSYRLGWTYTHLTHYFWSMRNLDRALAYGQHAVALAAPLGDSRLDAEAHHVLAEVHYSLGNYRQAIVAFEQLAARFIGDHLYERIGPAVFSVVSRRWLVQALAETGAFAAGIARGEEGIRIAETADHPYSLANMCSGFGYLYVCKGDFQKAIPFHARSLELSRVWNLRQNAASFALHFGHALALSGQIGASLALLEQSVETAELTRQIGRVPLSASLLSEVYWLAGRYEEAQTLAVQAYAHAHETKEYGSQAWTARLLGEMHAQGDVPDVEQAEAYYRQALALADERSMRPLQAHCHLGLGTLYATTGQREQARPELSAAINLYRAMEMTFWLPQAEQALAQVEGQ